MGNRVGDLFNCAALRAPLFRQIRNFACRRGWTADGRTSPTGGGDSGGGIEAYTAGHEKGGLVLLCVGETRPVSASEPPLQTATSTEGANPSKPVKSLKWTCKLLSADAWKARRNPVIRPTKAPNCPESSRAQHPGRPDISRSRP